MAQGWPGWVYLQAGATQGQLGGLQRWSWEGIGVFQPHCATATKRPQLGIPQPGSAQGDQPLGCTGGLPKARERPLMGQQAGNSLYQTQMAIWRLNQRLSATGQGTQLSEVPPNSVQIPKKIAGMALSCLPCRTSGQQGIPRVPRSTGKGQPKRASVKLLPWELSRGSSKLVKLGDGSWKPEQQGLLVFLRRNWVLLVELSLQGRGFFPPMKRIMREFHLPVPQQHHPSPSLTPLMAPPLQKTIKNLIIKQ